MYTQQGLGKPRPHSADGREKVEADGLVREVRGSGPLRGVGFRVFGVWGSGFRVLGFRGVGF